jgi:cytochrome c oxidase subunit I+III
MTDATYTGAAKGEPDKSFEEIWAQPRGWRALSSVSHRAVGKRFIITGFIFFLIAGFLALLVRTQLIVPENTFMSAETYNQVFTMHGTLMMFLFAIPILEGFAVYLIPMLVGARDMAFPRLGAFGFYCYVFGGVIVLSSFLFDAAPDGGWFMYVPLSTSEYTQGLSADFWLIGITFAEIASVTAAVEIIATILCSRAPGMTLTKMPIFCWYMLITALMIAIGFPPLIIGSILLEAERMLGLPFFDPLLGGDPLLWQHLFWLFGHPEVYIIFLPAAGMVATMLPTFVGKPLFGYGFAVAAVVTMGFLSFGLWAHHMFATGLPAISLSLFSAASTMVAVPTGIQIFCFIATLSLAKPRMAVPMLFILGFLFVFVIGGLTGVMLASVPFNWQAHDSHFVVAHLHYVLFGGMVFPLFGAFYYWVPHFTGRMMSETLGRWVFWLMFIGFNGTFFLMHITGLRGMPRRIATYPEGIGWDRLNLLSTLGSYMIAAAVLVFIWDFFRHQKKGPLAGHNPWGAATLEWLYPAVTPTHNFHAIPRITSREPMWDQPELTERHPRHLDGILRETHHNRRETVGCDPLTGEPIQVLRLPHPTWVPLITAAFVAVMFAALLAKTYWLVAVGGLGMMAGFTAWAWEPSDSGADYDVGMGLRLPVNIVDKRSHMHVAIVGTLLVSYALLASIIFGILFLWNIRPAFAETAGLPGLGFAVGAGSAGLVLAALGLMTNAQACRGHLGAAAGLGVVLAIVAVIAAALLGAALLTVDPWASALGAAEWVLAAFVGTHLFVVMYWSLINALRKAVGAVQPGQTLPDLNLATFAKGTGGMVVAAAVLFGVAAMGGAV